MKRQDIGRRVAKKIQLKDSYVYGVDEYMPYLIFELCRQSKDWATRMKNTSLMIDHEASRGLRIPSYRRLRASVWIQLWHAQRRGHDGVSTVRTVVAGAGRIIEMTLMKSGYFFLVITILFTVT